MNITFGNMNARLNIFNAIQQPQDEDECFSLDIIDEIVENLLPYILAKDPLEKCLLHDKFDDLEEEKPTIVQKSGSFENAEIYPR
jgi:hypothetical protein